MDHDFKPAQQLSTGELRKFGAVTAGMLAGVLGALVPWLFSLDYPLWPWIGAGLLMLVAAVVPAALRPVYAGWMRLGLLLSRVTTPVIMTAVYLLTIVPAALVMKLLRRDPMRRRFDPKAESYRNEAEPVSAASLEKPF